MRRTIIAIRDAAYLRSQHESGLSDADALTRAQALLAGESIDFRDGPAKVREAEARLSLVDPAIREAGRRVDLVRDKLSNEAAASLRTRHRKALADLYKAALVLGAAGQVERLIRGELIGAGYDWPEAVLPLPRFSIHMQIGDAGWADSPIATFRRQLEELQIL